jgi:ABC-type multidrug transport system fused ATPase/permease subunit
MPATPLHQAGLLRGVNWARTMPIAVAVLAAILLATVVWNALILAAKPAGNGQQAEPQPEQDSAPATPRYPEYLLDIARRFAATHWGYYASQTALIAVTVPIAVITVAKVSAEFTDAQSSAKLKWPSKLGAWQVLVAVLLVSFALRVARTTMREMVIPRATALISAALFDRYLRNFEAADTETDEGVGDVLYTLRQVTEDITWIVVVWITDVVSIVVMLAVLALYLGTVSTRLGLAGLAFALLVIGVGAAYNVRIVQKVIDFMNAERDIMGRGEQYVVNAATIAAYNARAEIGPDLAGFTDRLVKMRRDFTRAETGFSTAWRVLMLVFFAFVAYWCLRAGNRVDRTRMQTIITVLFLMLYWLLDLGADLVDMAWRFASVVNPYAMRLFNTSPQAAQDAARAAAMDPPEHAALQLQDVGFRYPPKPKQARRAGAAQGEEDEQGEPREPRQGEPREPETPPDWTIHPFSLAAEPGQRIVIKGGSGSGKSTLFKLLAGFETPTTGHIRLGDLDCADVTRRAWREHVLFVSQKWALFNGSVLDNMVLATGVRGVRPEAMNAYLRRYGLEAVIEDVGQQVGSSASTGGGQMSGGMGKVITLCRAALRAMPDDELQRHFPGAQRTHPRPRVVLFDEPLAALDEDSRAKAVRLMADVVAAPCISLYIMHNDDLDAHASRVLHIADGRLEEQTGTGPQPPRTGASKRTL